MIPVATILSMAGKVASGLKEWLNSTAGNMIKGWFKGRVDQRRKDTIAQQAREGREVTKIATRLQEEQEDAMEGQFGDRDTSPHIRVRRDGVRWKQNR